MGQIRSKMDIKNNIMGLPLLRDKTCNKNKILFILFFVFTLSIIIKLYMHFFDPVISRDGAHYSMISEEAFFKDEMGIEYDLIRDYKVMPFYIMLQKKNICLAGSGERSGISLNIVLGSIIPIIGFMICRRLFLSLRISLLTSVLLAVHPSLCKLSIQPQRDTLFLFLCGLSIFFAMSSLYRHHILNSCAAGCCLAFSFLTRIESIELILYMCLMYFLVHWCRSKRKGRFVEDFFFLISGFLLALCINLLLMSSCSSLHDIYVMYQNRI